MLAFTFSDARVGRRYCAARAIQSRASPAAASRAREHGRCGEEASSFANKYCKVACGQCTLCAGHPLRDLYNNLYACSTARALRRCARDQHAAGASAGSPRVGGGSKQAPASIAAASGSSTSSSKCPAFVNHSHLEALWPEAHFRGPLAVDNPLSYFQRVPPHFLGNTGVDFGACRRKVYIDVGAREFEPGPPCSSSTLRC